METAVYAILSSVYSQLLFVKRSYMRYCGVEGSSGSLADSYAHTHRDGQLSRAYFAKVRDTAWATIVLPSPYLHAVFF